MANGSLYTGSVGCFRVKFLGFDRLPVYSKLFQVGRIPVVVGDSVVLRSLKGVVVELLCVNTIVPTVSNIFN